MESPPTHATPVDFETDPSRYRHWRVSYDGPIATLAMAVDPEGGLRPGYELKLNSYDLGVDIELADVVRRMRFEHPEVRVVVLTSGLDNVFCAGANIHMLAASTHAWKVNFCKFTNETRCEIEDAEAYSGQVYIAAVNGPCAGGGYELALACREIYLQDDGSSAVSLPEVPLLGVLPGTGGLTRLVDKRKVRRDRADIFSTTAEGIRGKKAVEWRLVDGVYPRSFRELDDALLHLRFNRPGVGAHPAARRRRPEAGARARRALCDERRGDWFAQRGDPLTAPGAQAPRPHGQELLRPGREGLRFVGSALRARARGRPHLHARRRGRAGAVGLSPMNFGPLPMSNGLTRLATRFLYDLSRSVEARRERSSLDARRRREGGPRHLHARPHRLGRRGARRHRGAHEPLARRDDRHGGQPALRRPRDHGDQDLRPPLGLAELDLPAPQRVGARGALTMYGKPERPSSTAPHLSAPSSNSPPSQPTASTTPP
jgi:enoyl-CoA hydratase/carnithine racemase